MTACAGRVAAAAVLGVCVAGSCAGPPEQQGRWSTTGEMLEGRAELVAALLPSGQVLVAGGIGDPSPADGGAGSTDWTFLSSAELYDPVAGTWADAGSMLSPRGTRGLFPISKGPYSGKVMVGGGISAYNRDPENPWYRYHLLSTTELFDPTSRTWSPGPPMLKHSVGFLQLADGKLLAVGSFVSETDLTPSADVQILDLSDPEPTWRFVRPMNEPRANPALLLLDSGEVLAICGLDSRYADHLNPTAERYDPVADLWTRAASPPSKRYMPVVVKLPDGNVLFTAGCPNTFNCSDPQPPYEQGPDNKAWIYEPATDRWRETTPMNSPHAYANGVLLDSGKVLVAAGNWMKTTDGGQDWYPAGTPEIFDPSTETWSTTEPMPHYVSSWGAMLRLQSGAVLFAGGYTNPVRDPYNPPPGIPAAQIFRENP